MTIEGLTEDAYKTAVAAAVDLVRAEHPDLDLRAGTALRALVIEPGALLDSGQRDEINRLKTAMSLSAMERETTVPREDAEAVLSNFGLTLGAGAKATGLVRVNLIGTTQVTVRAGIEFTTEDSLRFIVTKDVTASIDPAVTEERIISSEDGRYYFTVPVEAAEAGSSGNLLQGHALTASVIIGNYASAEAFSNFSGGEDGETVASAAARIPAALAYRGMTNALSVRASLSAALPDPAELRAVSCVGHGDRAQLRDKHNPFGVSVGGRVDVYARLFDAPGLVTFVANGTLVEENGESYYRVDIPAHPGFYAVRFVGPADQPDRQGSLQYSLVRTHTDNATIEHDFDVSVDSVETAWTTYQGGHIKIYGGTDGGTHLGEHEEASATPETPNTKEFKVDLFWTDGITNLQAIIDAPSTCNVAADYVVRTPAICLVSMNTVVRLKSGVATTSTELEDVVAAYINGRSFVSRLTRSELANVLLQNGVESVDLSSAGMQLSGRICGADGVWYYLDGDSLDVTSVGPERAMLTYGTVVFAAEPGAIQVTIA